MRLSVRRLPRLHPWLGRIWCRSNYLQGGAFALFLLLTIEAIHIYLHTTSKKRALLIVEWNRNTSEAFPTFYPLCESGAIIQSQNNYNEPKLQFVQNTKESAKVLPTNAHFITTAESCEGLGNQVRMFPISTPATLPTL